MALVLCALLGGWGLSTGCGSGGAAAAAVAVDTPVADTPTTLTTDQANTVGTAAVDLALQAMTDSLAASQASASLSKGKSSHTLSSGKAAISTGSLTLTAATSCAAPTMTSECASPTQTVDVSLTGTTSGTCSGTVRTCDTKNYVNLTCTNYSAGTAILNGTVSFEMNTDTCDPVSSVSADLSTTVNGASCPISLALATTKTADVLGTTGCFTVCGSGFEFTTSVNASDVATCTSGSCTNDLAELALLFGGTSCTYTSGSPTATDTFSSTMLVDLAAEAAQRQCLMYAACSTYSESSCMSASTFEAAAAGCGVSMGGSPKCQTVGGECPIDSVSSVDFSVTPNITTALATGDNLTIDTNASTYLQFVMSEGPANVLESCVVCDTDADFSSAYEVECHSDAILTVTAGAANFKDITGFRAACWNGSFLNTHSTAFKVRYKLEGGSTIDTSTTFILNVTLQNP